MPYSILVFATRKNGMTLEEFKDYGENVHMPLLKELAGEFFPIQHSRRYIARTTDANTKPSDTDPNATTPAVVFVGSPADIPYDAVNELVFKDQEHFKGFMQAMGTPEKTRIREEDEAKFLDKGSVKILALADTQVTTA